MWYVKMHEDQAGDLVDIDHYCTAFCYEQRTGEAAFGHAWPGGMEADYNIYCAYCGTLMYPGEETG